MSLSRNEVIKQCGSIRRSLNSLGCAPGHLANVRLQAGDETENPNDHEEYVLHHSEADGKKALVRLAMEVFAFRVFLEHDWHKSTRDTQGNSTRLTTYVRVSSSAGKTNASNIPAVTPTSGIIWSRFGTAIAINTKQPAWLVESSNETYWRRLRMPLEKCIQALATRRLRSVLSRSGP